MNRRKTLGLTQRDIANTLGITDQAVSDWERGVRTPRLSPRQSADLCQLMQFDIFQLADLFDSITPKQG
jgi:putative transcriptional regulator